MPVSAFWSPIIKAMLFPHLSERHTPRKHVAFGCCLYGSQLGCFRRIQWGRGPHVADMGMIHEPGDQALETDLFRTVDRDTLVGHGNGIVFTLNGDTILTEDNAIFSLTIADDNALFPV